MNKWILAIVAALVLMFIMFSTLGLLLYLIVQYPMLLVVLLLVFMFVNAVIFIRKEFMH